MTGVVLLGAFLSLVALGMPIAYAMGLSALGALLVLDIPLNVFFTRTLASINSFSLLAIPFFILAGDLLTVGGISKRLIDFANSLVASARGGLGMASVASMAMFSGISGSAAADTIAVGGVMIPAMKRSGYDAGWAAALIAASGTLGPLIPPSILLVLYGGITGLSIGALLIASVIPGFVVAGLLMALAWWQGKAQADATASFSLKAVWSTLVRAVWALLLPVFLVVGIIAGMFTATEGGVIVLVYGAVVSLFIHKELHLGELWPLLVRSTIMSGVLMLVVAMAAGFAWILAYTRVPAVVLSAVTGFTTDPTIIVLIVVAVLLVLGMFVETVAAAVITVPVLFPLGEAVGIDPLHFAIVIVVALMVGTITPPVGILLYVTAGIAEITVAQAVRAAVPFIALLIVAAIVISLVPQLSTWLPGLIRG